MLPTAAPVPQNFPKLVLDDGRVAFRKPKPRRFWLDVHGEIQMRVERDSELPLRAPIGDPTLQTLGQRTLGTGWIRLGLQAGYGETLKLVLQGDLAPNWLIGDLAQGVSAATDYARDTPTPSAARLRYAYVNWETPIGVVRAGQMGSYWGMGLLANDGDHPLVFGDYKLGTLVERLAFATKPGGKQSPFVIALAGDYVWSDATASSERGDRTGQVVLAAYWEQGQNQAGLYGVRRWQGVHSNGDNGNLDAWIVDAAARGVVPLAAEGVYAFGAVEAAAIFGHTNVIRTVPDVPESDVRSYGGAAQLGILKSARASDGRTYGSVVVQLEYGYASGDGNPYDSTIKRFTFDPNHQIGLVMFPFVMHYSYARAATNALDPQLAARPPSGVSFLNTNGGVSGAQYLNPTIIVRPTPDFDLKAGIVVAVSTADFIDPYGLTVTGKEANFNGGSGKSHDLGFELDWGAEWRIHIPLARVALGLQQGLLVPGHAFDDAQGHSMPLQSVTQLRFGLQF